MSDSTPGRNAISSIGEAKELADNAGFFFLIRWSPVEGSKHFVLKPVDFTPLGPFTIDEIHGEGSETIIRVEALACNMRIGDFFRKYGGMFESVEHIEDYELRLKWLGLHTEAYLERLNSLGQQAEEAAAAESLPEDVRDALQERKSHKLQ